MKKLEGKKIALLGSRKVEAICTLVEKFGGIPLSRPAQGIAFLDEAKLKENILQILQDKYDWYFFTTGIGIETLYNVATNMVMGNEFIAILQKSNIAARGYKTINMLKKLGLTPLVKDDDGSTKGLIRSLSDYSFKYSNVALQLHGEPAIGLTNWLHEKGAEFEEIMPYIHIPPVERVMQQLLFEILNEKIDALVFTSTPQVRYLMNFARQQDVEKELLDALNSKIVALAVGKVTAQALHNEKIERVIFPKVERIGSAIIELSNFYFSKV